VWIWGDGASLWDKKHYGIHRQLLSFVVDDFLQKENQHTGGRVRLLLIKSSRSRVALRQTDAA
jgi:hypothetical protein